MGAACCCLRDGYEELANPSNNSIYRKCICLRCFVQSFIHMYTSLFPRGGALALPSPTPGTSSLSPTVSLDNSIADVYRSPPRPLPYEADPRYFWLQRDGLISRREKGSSHSHEDTEPLRTSEDDDEESDLPVTKKRNWKEFECEEGSKEYNSKSSFNLSTAKATAGYAHLYTSSEDEDVCPTCLEEYTTENPKINAKCSHHFHLGCIYEWMERSDNCPVCGKEIISFIQY